MRKLLLTLTVSMCLALPHWSNALAQGKKNRIWVGEVEAISINTPVGKNPYIKVELAELQDEGRFGRYNFERSVVWSPLEGDKKGARIQLDGAFPAKFANFVQAFKHLTLKAVRVKSVGDSVQFPNLATTRQGRAFEHTVLEIETTREILINTTLLRDDNGQFVTLKFSIVPREATDDRSDLSNFLEFSTENFDRPPTRPLVTSHSRQTQKFIDRSLEALSATRANDYVTAVYPVRYADPNMLAGMIRNRLSQLGRVDVDNDRSRIVVTDRARFVKPAIETMLSLDKKPPQVTIVAQIIEISRGNGTKIGVDFSYLGRGNRSGLSGGNYSTSGILGTGGPILSGVYQSFSKGVLRQFAADVNLLLEKRKAKITAQPVIRVLNNVRGTFNAGENLPFFIQTTESQNQNAREYQQRSLLDRIVGEDIQSTSTLGEDRSVQDATRFQERRKNFNIRQVRTGTRLIVTPRIRNSDECLLNVNASFNEVTGFAANSGNPIIAERSVDTRIRVRHGETIIIGGLYREVEITQSSGVPWVSEVPGIGKLFKSERKSQETRDIVFILTTFVQHN